MLYCGEILFCHNKMSGILLMLLVTVFFSLHGKIKIFFKVNVLLRMMNNSHSGQ